MTARTARSLIITGVLLLAIPPVHSETGEGTQDEDAEIGELLDVLAEETAIATQTKMNADFVPGIVSVLEGDELRALGARNVGEAIALVPGLQANRDVYGLPLYFVRGVPFFDSAGGFKVLVDGLTLSRENSGVSGAVLTMSIMQVERIEVIRGPGSGVWGDYAFVGLINIVTRKEANELWLAGGNRDLRTGGGAGSFDGDLIDVSATVSGWHTAGGDSPDATPPSSLYIPGREVESGIGTFEARVKGFTFTGSAVKRDYGKVTESTRHFPGDETSWVFEAKHSWAFGPGRSVDAYARYLDSDTRILAISHESSLWQLGADVGWKIGRHSLLFRGTYGTNTIREAIFVAPGNPPPPNTVVTDLDEGITAVVAQDSIEVGDDWTFTLGFRYDDQSDLGSVVTPRAAAVWRIAEGHIVKAQYAEGFRAPTFQYLYSEGEVLDRDVEFEEVETTDLEYIYRRAGAVGRVTLFHSEFSNLRIPPPPYKPGADAKATGVEVEWEQSIAERIKVIANVSWVHPEDERPTPNVPGADSVGYAAWVGNLAVLGRLPAGFLLGLHWNHVGQRDLGAEDEEGYDLVNLTASWSPERLEALSLRAGMRNVLDDDIKAVYYFVGGVQRPTFTGRTWMLEAAWRF